jgi:hypothetical protein
MSTSKQDFFYPVRGTKIYKRQTTAMLYVMRIVDYINFSVAMNLGSLAPLLSTYQPNLDPHLKLVLLAFAMLSHFAYVPTKLKRRCKNSGTARASIYPSKTMSN